MRRNKFSNCPIHGEIKVEEEGIQEVAIEMLKKGLPIDLIAEVTKLDEKEILDLKGTL